MKQNNASPPPAPTAGSRRTPRAGGGVAATPPLPRVARRPRLPASRGRRRSPPPPPPPARWGTRRARRAAAAQRHGGGVWAPAAAAGRRRGRWLGRRVGAGCGARGGGCRPLGWRARVGRCRRGGGPTVGRRCPCRRALVASAGCGGDRALAALVEPYGRWCATRSHGRAPVAKKKRQGSVLDRVLFFFSVRVPYVQMDLTSFRFFATYFEISRSRTILALVS